MLNRTTAFLYGVACYLVSLVTFLFIAGFLGNVGLAKTIDSEPQVPFTHALAINCALLGLFALQHSIMARPWFKAVWTRVIPPVVERSTYLLFSCVAVFLLIWQWRPMGGVIWNVETPQLRVTLYALQATGWIVVLAATFLLNHFDLFGLRQVWLHLRSRPYTSLVFRTPGMYRFVRHPLYLGWLLVFWSAPTMTAAHLVFASGMAAYIFVAIQFEERDLTQLHPEYAGYRQRVPMILPTGTPASLGTSDAEA
jgi:protein-S-isoprenylcysteine O-methyltransferase Ste14